MYKTVLVPIDLSHPELGNKTLELARGIAGQQSRIVALYVSPEIPAYIAAGFSEEFKKKSLQRAKDELKAIADKAGAESVILSGHAPMRILEHANSIHADLIVIASHRPGLQDYFLGSTAARVVRHADCAVLIDR